MLDLDEETEARVDHVTLRRLVLTDFRSYTAATIGFDGRSVVFTGANGAGKTNILEAISLFAPGRGLRRAPAEDLPRQGGAGGWALAAVVDMAGGVLDLGTGVTPGADTTARIVRIARVTQRSTTALAEHLSIVWLTPDLDGLFRGPAGDRRRFLDRLVLTLDAAHGTRVAALERLNRERNRLLAEPMPDAAWLDALEHELAGVAVAVAAARRTTVERLARSIAAHADPASPFPWAALAIEGAVEATLDDLTAAAAEDSYRAALAALRGRDAAAGRATVGPHLTDLAVRHGPKDIVAARASTGEQKALLVGLVLAHARLVAEMTGRSPLLLLDEVAAHLDALRRAGLYAEIDAMGAQAFMTGTDAAMFAGLAGRAQMFEVAAGGIVERPSA